MRKIRFSIPGKISDIRIPCARKNERNRFVLITQIMIKMILVQNLVENYDYGQLETYYGFKDLD